MAINTPPGYRSATDYCFDEEHTDAIIRTVGYENTDFPLSLIWFLPRELDRIRSSIATPFQKYSSVELGLSGGYHTSCLWRFCTVWTYTLCSNFDK
ncbi:hypothetical protein BDV19DRAFT_62980 [Aspergillus venezuelensis]